MYVIQHKEETDLPPTLEDSVDTRLAESFLDAFREMRDGKISWEEYIHKILSLCTVRDTTVDDPGEWQLRYIDPFGFGIYGWGSTNTVNDIAPLEEVFKAYRSGCIADVRHSLSLLEDELAKCMRESLAYLAVKDRCADMLEMCFEGRFRYEGYFQDEADSVDPESDPETFRVLEHSRFRQSYPRKDPADYNSDNEDDDDTDSGVGYDDAELDELARDRAAAAFDVGGRFPVEW